MVNWPAMESARVQSQSGFIARLSDQTYYWLIEKAPLLVPALAICGGVIVGSLLPVKSTLWPILVLIVGGSSAVVVLKATRVPGKALLTVCASGFAALGLIRALQARNLGPDHIASIAKAQPRLVSIRGLVRTEPIRNGPSWSFSQLYPFEPATTFRLEVKAIRAIKGLQKCKGTVQVWVGGPIANVNQGDLIQVDGWLIRPGPVTNPGQFDYAEYLHNHGVHATIRVRSAHALKPLGRSILGHVLYGVHLIRSRTREAIRYGFSGPECDLVEALLVGFRNRIDSNTYLSFKYSGLAHYLSLSGMHFGIIVATSWFVGGVLGLLPPARAAICALVAGLYLLMIPGTAPTWRAAIISWVYCAAVIARRPCTGWNTLALAAIILVLGWPGSVFDIGWQLSFASVAGILLLADPWQRPIPRTGPRWARSSLPASIIGWLLDSFRTLLLVGVSASLGNAGLIVYHFHTFNLLSAIWTALVFPLVWTTMVLGLIKLIASAILPCLGAPITFMVRPVAKALIWLVQTLAGLDLLTLRIGLIGPGPVIAYYALLAIAVLWPWRRPLMRAGFILACGACIVGWVWICRHSRLYGPNLEITCLDVGHGQAAFVRGPKGQSTLLDGGSLYIPDVGTRVVIPFLEAMGIDALDQIIISHTDIDHVNGIPEIIKAFKTKAVFVDLDQGQASTILKRIFSGRHGILRPISDLAGQANGGLEILAIWPRPDTATSKLSDNDRSVVTLIRFAARSILFCSDIEQYAQKQIMELYPGLKVDVMVLPHHGSPRTRLEGLIRSMDPKFVICSCTDAQARQVIVDTELDGREVYCTGRDGAVTIRISPSGHITVSTYLPTSN